MRSAAAGIDEATEAAAHTPARAPEAPVRLGTALWALSRPRLAPFVAALPGLGWGFALWDRALPAPDLSPLVALTLAWFALHAGTMWLNAALDRDEGEVLLGDPVPVPSSVSAWGHGALLVAIGLASWASPVAGVAAFGCALLAEAYSHPRWAWKGHPVGGPAVNVLGYAVLSPLAGHAVTGLAPSLRTLVLWPAVWAGVLGAWLVAQAFQGPEDAARGYRTFVVTRGPSATLGLARVCFGAAWALGAALAIVGWLPALLLVALPAALWVDRWLARWQGVPGGGTAGHARELARRLGWALALGLALVGMDHAIAVANWAPAAGLATRAGHPADRVAFRARHLALLTSVRQAREVQRRSGYEP